MQRNTLQQTELKPLTRPEVKKEMKRRKGFGSYAAYARLIHRHRSTAMRLADGQIGGDLRERFLDFFGFSEEEIPYRGPQE